MAKQLFKEVQYFRQNPVWTIALMIPVFVFGSILIYQLATGMGVGERPYSNRSLAVLATGVLIPTVLAVLRVKLTTIIYEDRICYGWNMPTPQLNEIPFSEIKEISVIKYDFIGYGYRFSRRYGTVHNMSGNRGIQIVTKSGEKVLIGTHRLRDLDSVLGKITTGIGV